MWSDESYLFFLFFFFNLTSNHLIFLLLKLVNKNYNSVPKKHHVKEKDNLVQNCLFCTIDWLRLKILTKTSFLQSQCHEKILESKMVILFLFYIFLYKIKFSCPSGHSKIKNSLSLILKKNIVQKVQIFKVCWKWNDQHEFCFCFHFVAWHYGGGGERKLLFASN